MKPKLVLLASYFLLTPLFILTLIFYQLYLYHQNSTVSSRGLSFNSGSVKYKALPQTSRESGFSLVTNEARIDVLREFLGKYKSPLTDYSEELVEAADKYGLDYRLLPAIAMQESTLCLKAPKGTNNCWGFGIYGKKKTAFDDYGQAIETVSKTLAKEYHAKGLVEPDEIMTKYTPSNDGEWAENVSYVMDRISLSL